MDSSYYVGDTKISFTSLEAQGDNDKGGVCCNCIFSITAIALIVLGALAGAGILSSTAIGGSVIGISVASGGSLVCTSPNLQSGKIIALVALLATIALITLGSLTLTGIVDPTVMGWITLGSGATAFLSSCCICCYVFKA